VPSYQPLRTRTDTNQLPDDSSIRLELTNIGDSSVNGFAGATLTPLPFTVDVADVEILLGLAFRPTIPVGFEFSNNLKAEVFVSMDLPRLDAKLSTDVAANCAGDLAAIGPLALVEANISVTIDAGVGLSLPILPAPFDELGVAAQIFSVGFPLITACADPSAAFAAMTATMPAMETPANYTAMTTLYKNKSAEMATATLYNANGTAETTLYKNKASNATATVTAALNGTVVSATPAPCEVVEATSVAQMVHMTKSMVHGAPVRRRRAH
jgi:hypothetical protein